MNRIKELRMAAGIKQSTLAAALNVSAAALSGYETGRFEATTETYQRIANYFGVSLDALITGSEGGAAVVVQTVAEEGEKLTDKEKKSCFVDDIEGLDESPLACQRAQ